MKRLSIVALFACGCSISDPAGFFVGTWQYYQGSTVTTQCSTSSTANLVGGVTYSRGSAALTIVPDQQSLFTLAAAQNGSCVIALTASHSDTGDMADLGSPVSCDLVTTGGNITVDFSYYRVQQIDITGPGLAPNTLGVGESIEADVSGASGSCHVSVDATLVK